MRVTFEDHETLGGRKSESYSSSVEIDVAYTRTGPSINGHLSPRDNFPGRNSGIEKRGERRGGGEGTVSSL